MSDWDDEPTKPAFCVPSWCLLEYDRARADPELTRAVTREVPVVDASPAEPRGHEAP